MSSAPCHALTTTNEGLVIMDKQNNSTGSAPPEPLRRREADKATPKVDIFNADNVRFFMSRQLVKERAEFFRQANRDLASAQVLAETLKLTDRNEKTTAAMLSSIGEAIHVLISTVKRGEHFSAMAEEYETALNLSDSNLI